MRFYVYTALASVLVAAAPAMAGPPNAQAIVQGMKGALEPDRPSTPTLVLAVRAADGSTTEWTARSALHQGEGAAEITKHERFIMSS
jgi:hypothetical protein